MALLFAHPPLLLELPYTCAWQPPPLPSPTHIHNPNPPTTPSFQLLSLNHTLQSTLVLSLHPALAFSAALQRTMQIQQACNVDGAPGCIFLFHINWMNERFFCSPSLPIIIRGVSSERDWRQCEKLSKRGLGCEWLDFRGSKAPKEPWRSSVVCGGLCETEGPWACVCVCWGGI